MTGPVAQTLAGPGPCPVACRSGQDEGLAEPLPAARGEEVLGSRAQALWSKEFSRLWRQQREPAVKTESLRGRERQGANKNRNRLTAPTGQTLNECGPSVSRSILLEI